MIIAPASAASIEVVCVFCDRPLLSANQLRPTAEAAKETLGVERVDVTADTGFSSAVAIKGCLDSGITPYVPELPTSPRAVAKKSGVPTPEFYKDKFTYDKSTDPYVCPAGQRLEFLYWLEDDGKTFGAYRTDACASCPLLHDEVHQEQERADRSEMGTRGGARGDEDEARDPPTEERSSF